MSDKIERERKFLVKFRPSRSEVSDVSTASIITYYLKIGETEERIRAVFSRDEQKFFHAIKKGLGLEREESEKEIPYSEYRKMKEPLNTEPVKKVRYTFTDISTGARCEHDVYSHNGLFEDTVEVEFASLKEAEDFVPPYWFGEEVTENKEYKNQSLFKRLNNL